jgi:hypothetical protein
VALVFGPPVLADDDPVVLQVLRMCGAQMQGANIVGGGGLTLTDVKAFLVDHRNEFRDQLVEPSLEGEVWVDTRWWGADAVLHDMEDPVATDVALPHEGYWLLADPGLNIAYIHGYAYDIYAASADLLESWAQHLKLEFDFSDGSGSYQRSQKVQNMLQMAGRYRSQQSVRQVQLFRSDTISSGGGGDWDPFTQERWGG